MTDSPATVSMPPGFTLLARVLMVLGMLVTASGCAASNMITMSEPYWESRDDVAMSPDASAAHWANLHAEHVAPFSKNGWASLVAEGDAVRLAFAPRCARLVEIPREQYQDFQHKGGWTADTMLYSLAAAVPAFIAGGIGMSNAGEGWDDELAAGHPYITSYNSNQTAELTGIIGLSVGSALAALSGTAIALMYVTTSDIQNTESWYGVRSQDCDDKDEHLLELSARADTLTMTDAVSFSVAGDGQLGFTSEGGVPAGWIESLLSDTMTLTAPITVKATVDAAHDPRQGQQSITLEQGRDTNVLNNLARAFANQGVHVNRAGPATLTPAESGFMLTVDANAAIAPKGGGDAAALKTRMGDSAVVQGGMLMAAKVVSPPNPTITEGIDRASKLASEKVEGAVRFTTKVPVSDAQMAGALATWTDDGSAPTFTDSANNLTWRLPADGREALQAAHVSAVTKMLTEHDFKAIGLSEKSYVAKDNMTGGLPAAGVVLEQICQAPKPHLTEGCAAFTKAWAAKETKRKGDMAREILARMKAELGKTTSYFKEQQRLFNKREEPDISEDADAGKEAANYCSSIASVEKVVCGNDAVLPSSAACKLSRSCVKSIAGRIKSLTGKMRARREAQERKEEAEARRRSAKCEVCWRSCNQERWGFPGCVSQCSKYGAFNNPRGRPCD